MQESKDPFKLTSIDEHGGHLNIIPAEVKGYFRRHRTRVHFVLLLLFLGLPWVHMHRVQLIFLNIPKREFNLFGLIFKSHDAPLIFLLLAILTLGLAFVTAIWGRVWCGWACPQTVFIDAVYRKIEIWTEGRYLQRRALQAAPLSLSKFLKKSSKWMLFVLVSTLIAHSFVAYFTGSYELVEMMQRPPAENWNYFVLIFIFTVGITFNFGWFREQFCVIMCPYGRIQSVLLEPNSLAVIYDKSRGEPRRGSGAKEVPPGACVSCNRCVEACPTGIDIRNGLQMECISCTACIDACDEIMKKLKQPPGLVSYRTLDGSRLQIMKLKTVAYGILILFSVVVLGYNLKTREPVEIAVLRGIEAPYSQDFESDGTAQIINHFRIHLTSQSDQDRNYRLQLSAQDLAAGLVLTAAQNTLNLISGTSEIWHLFVRGPLHIMPSGGKLNFHLRIDSPDGFETDRELTFLGPTK